MELLLEAVWKITKLIEWIFLLLFLNKHWKEAFKAKKKKKRSAGRSACGVSNRADI